MGSAGKSGKMGLHATWAMAVGGMVGGGIFSVLGVVVALAGEWAWLSFVLAGLIALCTGHSYLALARRFSEGGGAFTYLRDLDREGLAGSLSWILIIGYVLTISVYAFTFGHYLAAVVGLGSWFPRLAGLAIVVSLVVVNLQGVGEASWLEVVTVWGKLVVLIGLAGVGLAAFAPDQLRYSDASPGGFVGALVGAASIFMAYEGFQLLTYDWEDIDRPAKTLTKAVLTAIVCVIGVYLLVALGAASLVGSSALVSNKEIALAGAGEAALGTAGMVLVSIAAAFSTASAINATLFSTARLTYRVADDGELPKTLEHRNAHDVPDRAVMVVGGLGALLAILGELGALVEAASLAFLFTFATVNFLAARHTKSHRWIAWLGALGAIAAGLTLLVRLALTEPYALAGLAGLGLVALVGRPLWMKRKR